jgi:hypothetical protein
MAIPFANSRVAAIWLALNNSTYKPLLDFLDDLATSPTPDTLLVGDTTDGYYDYDDDYSASGLESWLAVDGINPPTVPMLRMPDKGTGAMYHIEIRNGAIFVHAA